MPSKQLLLIPALLMAYVSMAQDSPSTGLSGGTGVNIHDHLLIQVAKDALGEGSEGQVEGSPYLTEGFTKGTVISAKGVFPGMDMRYNIHGDVIEFRQKNQTYLLDPLPDIIRVDMGDHRLVVNAPGGKERPGFYELLDSGRVMLLARLKVNFQEARPPQALQSESTPARYIRMPDTYYYQISGGPLTKVTSLKKLLADLPGDRLALADFADQKKISVRSREELIRLVRHCNGAVH